MSILTPSASRSRYRYGLVSGGYAQEPSTLTLELRQRSLTTFFNSCQIQFGCGSFRTGDSGAVERKMDLSYYGSGEGILGLGSWVGQNNLTRKTDRLDFWIFLLHPLQVRARGAAHRDQLAVRVARGMVSERLLPLVKAPIGVEVSAGLQRTQA